MKVAEEFERLLRGAAAEVGKTLNTNTAAVRQLAEAKMLELATIIDQPGYERALIAARNIVAIEAGIAAVGVADDADQRLVGLITGALGIGARALAGA